MPHGLPVRHYGRSVAGFRVSQSNQDSDRVKTGRETVVENPAGIHHDDGRVQHYDDVVAPRACGSVDWPRKRLVGCCNSCRDRVDRLHPRIHRFPAERRTLEAGRSVYGVGRLYDNTDDGRHPDLSTGAAVFWTDRHAGAQRTKSGDRPDSCRRDRFGIWRAWLVTSKGRQCVQLVLALGFGLFLAFSFLVGFQPGRKMGQIFGSTGMTMLGLLPCAFVLIGLFDVWAKRETIEKHLGEGSGIRGYVWSLLLAGMTVGGLYVAIPVSCALASKGARLSVILAYVGFAGVCRIPMVLFEISFMGWTFTIVRLAISIPLVLVTSWLLGMALEQHGYCMEQ